MGCDLFGASVQHGIHPGSLSPDEKSPDPHALRADSRRVLATVRTRCALLRSLIDVGADPAARALRQSARMEGQQLLPTDARSAEWPRPPATQGRLSMPTLKHASALRRESTTAEQIPYTAHVAPMVVRTAFGDYLQAFRLGGSSFES